MNDPSPVQGRRQRIWTFLRILNVRLRFIILMVVTGLIAAKWETITAYWERWTTRDELQEAQVDGAIEYYCPMHPSVVRQEPGNCPICGMPLSRRERGLEEVLPEGVLGRVQLAPYRMQLAGIATSEVAYVPLRSEVRAVGTIEMDERRVAHIAARVAGRIERLHVNFTGERVERGQPLVEIYSPDLVSTQQEYLTAGRGAARLASEREDPIAGDARALVQAARERLRLWGMDEEQIQDLDRAGEPALRVTIRSPITGVVIQKNVLAGQYVMEGTELYTVADLSDVWMTANVYEDVIAEIRTGQTVEITGRTHPGRIFTGKISFIWPVLDRATRTLRIRVNVPNSDVALRPGMYVEARILTGAPGGDPTGLLAMGARPGGAGGGGTYVCPMHPEVVSSEPGTCPKCGMFLEKVEEAPAGAVLAIPESAVIDTGTRKVVYLEREPGTFDAVAVVLGPLANDHYPVLQGLALGDRVVTRGAFLVDAELRLSPAAAGSYFGASGGPSQERTGAGEHQH